MKSFLKKYPGLLLTVVLAAAIACALPHCEHTPSYQPGGPVKIAFCGESHGVSPLLEEELALWHQYYRRGSRDLFIEDAYFTAQALNLWMRAGDDTILKRIYRHSKGSPSHTPATLAFYRSIKQNEPQTVFHGTDVGHRYDTDGAWYLTYLKNHGRTHTEAYRRTLDNIRQGKRYYRFDLSSPAADAWREARMVENFEREYRSLKKSGRRPVVMGIYGSFHCDMQNPNAMACRLRSDLGDILSTRDMTQAFLAGRSYRLGFSCFGAALLFAIALPKLILRLAWPPAPQASPENRILAAMKRIGAAAAATAALIFTAWDPVIFRGADGYLYVPGDNLYLLLILGLLAVYARFWIRRFRNGCPRAAPYADFAGFPATDATLVFLMLLLLGIYGRQLLMTAAAVIFGVGAIGPAVRHSRLSSC